MHGCWGCGGQKRANERAVHPIHDASEAQQRKSRLIGGANEGVDLAGRLPDFQDLASC
jgi:hypothetical protein